MLKSYSKIALLILTTVIVCSCSTAQKSTGVERIQREPLRVGVTPNYPPVMFKLGESIAGIEVDMAKKLAQELDRPVEFLELRWEQLIPYLMEGKFDIIMSGMSITRARKVRIIFTDHYLKSGQLAAFRTEDSQKYSSRESILESYASVGVIEGTTSDVFVQRNFPRAQRVALSDATAGAFELKRRRIDIFVHDAPSIMWLVSENEAGLTGFWEPFNEEYLAWGVRRDNQEFFVRVNDILRKWKQDGTLNRILLKWLPPQYLERFK